MTTTPGNALELGARLNKKGVNFALFSANASEVSLILYEHKTDTQPVAQIPLDPEINRTGDIWHIQVEGVEAGALYGWKVFAPGKLKDGHRFDRKRILLDPYAKAITDLQGTPKSIVSDDDFDWEGVKNPRIPWKDTIIYETHIKGLTVHPSSGVEHPGTYLGVIEKIPHLKELGVTAVEFLPLQEFNHLENPRRNPLTGEFLGNYWGYSTIAYFAPKGSYCSSGNAGGQVIEFRQMVKALHRAGIEIILDVVFNHTAEMNRLGPVYNFKGIDNSQYYLLQEDRRRYQNLTGCGNTVFCNNPPVIRFILDCLRYWVTMMGVDGFRFDLATIFYRGEKGEWLPQPLLVEALKGDSVLKNTKLIAEAWDAAGGYNVGSFGGDRFADWNDRFRDEVRRFFRGDENTIGAFASRISGSQDLFGFKDTPLRSINFITCHDGFTLNDLVSYKRKHNLANGHSNHDGANQNFSQNFGMEGETEDLKIIQKRNTAAKSFFAVLMLSQGIPMMLGGDEFLRTQGGNNNSYCQDNEISWYNWDSLRKNGGFHQFCREMIRFRKEHPALRRTKFFTGKNAENIDDIVWLDKVGNPQDWKGDRRRLACMINGAVSMTPADKEDCDIYIIFNSAAKSCSFKIPPPLNGSHWLLAIDTGQDSPDDIYPPGSEKELRNRNSYTLKAKSVAVFISEKNNRHI